MPDTKYWLKQLQDGFNQTYPGRVHRFRLPSGISFRTIEDGVRLLFCREAVEDGNMQSDAAAFEAWALALHGYARVPGVELCWAGAASGPHAWRFRVRAHAFARCFHSWFQLGGDLAPAMEPGTTYVLNVESEPRRGPVKPFSTELRERGLEDLIVRDPEFSARFKHRFDIEFLGQQLPVGVFKNSVAKKNAVSPRGSAAIDIWGVKGTTLRLFELKRFSKAGGGKLGILSELFLYALLMRGIQTKALTFGGGGGKADYNRIEKTRAIEAWLLTPTLHPLIAYGDAPIIELMNRGLEAAKEPITFHRAFIEKEGQFRKA